MASSYKGLTTKELISRLTASDKENAKLVKLVKELETALISTNNSLCIVGNERDILKTSLENSQANSADSFTKYENAKGNLKQALDERDSYLDLYQGSNKKISGLIRDLDYERKRRISAENKAFDLETRLHNTVASEYPASDIPSYMVGVRIDRNGEIA